VIGHHPHDGDPTVGGISCADAAVKSVTAVAICSDHFLPIPIGEFLAPGGKRRAQQSDGQQGRSDLLDMIPPFRKTSVRRLIAVTSLPRLARFHLIVVNVNVVLAIAARKAF
jgi:hypothetical protein